MEPHFFPVPLLEEEGVDEEVVLLFRASAIVPTATFKPKLNSGQV
jgi:hypothetical protein